MSLSVSTSASRVYHIRWDASASVVVDTPLLTPYDTERDNVDGVDVNDIFVYDLAWITDWSTVDAVLLSSHTNALAIWYVATQQNFKGLLLASEPTIELIRQSMTELEKYHCYATANTVNVSMLKRQKRIRKPHSATPSFTYQQFSQCIDRITVIRFGETKVVSPLLSITAGSSGYTLGSCHWLLQYGDKRVAIIGDACMDNTRFPAPIRLDMMRHVDAMVFYNLSNFSNTTWSAMMSNFESFIGTQLSKSTSIIIPTTLSNPCYVDILHALFRLTTTTHLMQKNVTIIAISPAISQFLSICNVTAEYLAQPYQDRGYSAQLPLIPLDIPVMADRFLALHSPDDPRLVQALVTTQQANTPTVVLVGYQYPHGGDFVEVLEIVSKVNHKDSPADISVGFVDPTWTTHMMKSTKEVIKSTLGNGATLGYAFLDPRVNQSNLPLLLDQVSPKQVVLCTSDALVIKTAQQWQSKDTETRKVEVLDVQQEYVCSLQIELGNEYVQGWLSPMLLESLVDQPGYKQFLKKSLNEDRSIDSTSLTLINVSGTLNLHNHLNVTYPLANMSELEILRSSKPTVQYVGQVTWNMFTDALHQDTGVKYETHIHQMNGNAVHELIITEHNLRVIYNGHDQQFEVIVTGEDNGFRKIVTRTLTECMYKLG